MAMTGIERIGNILQRKPVDRIGLYEHFWGDTCRKWTDEGHLREGESLEDHFGFDLSECGAFNMVADLDFTPEVVEETEETQLIRDGNGALLRRHKLHDATPEHVDFTVRERTVWEEFAKPRLVADRRRINFEAYRAARDAARAHERFFFWAGVNVFELMSYLCGHEYMLMGMAVDPDWIKDMVSTYSRLNVDLMEILFAEEGAPEGVWFYDDLGFKQRPFISPDMYREIIQPGHKRTFDYAKSRGLPVVLHSCGFVAPLIPGMLEAGIDGLQVIEVKAGMDLLQLHKDFGDRLSFIGGTDVRVLYSNDRDRIEAELCGKIPVVKEGYGYVLHTDHSVPDQVEYASYRYFVDRGLELGQY